MSDSGWVVVARWDEFQHPDVARSKVPPWVKNHTRLLSDEAYLNLTPHQRAVLHGLWLEYARTRRQLTANTASLTRRLALRVTTRQLKALNEAGFIQIVASKPASTVASLEGDREREVEKKNSTNSKTYPNSARPEATNVYAEELARLEATATNGSPNGHHPKPDEPYFDRLLTTVGNTEQNFAKLRRAARGQPTAAIIAALEAAASPTTREPIAVALTVLSTYGQEAPSEQSG